LICIQYGVLVIFKHGFVIWSAGRQWSSCGDFAGLVILVVWLSFLRSGEGSASCGFLFQ